MSIEKKIQLPFLDTNHDVYFYFEHVNNIEIAKKYDSYAEEQKEISGYGRLQYKEHEGLVPFHNVIRHALNKCLGYIQYPLEKYTGDDIKDIDVYVASVSSKSRNDPTFEIEEDVEMIVSIMMKKDYQISTHMGISRNVRYGFTFKNKMKRYLDDFFNKKDLLEEGIKNFDDLGKHISDTKNIIQNELDLGKKRTDSQRYDVMVRDSY